MRYAIIALFVCVSFAQTLPYAPSASKQKVANRSFWALTGFTVAANMADATTTAAMVGHGTDACRYERGTTFLYGRSANDIRVFAVMGAETVGAAVAAYYLKKHNVRIGRFKLWTVPLIASGLGHGVGATNNMRRCRFQ